MHYSKRACLVGSVAAISLNLFASQGVAAETGSKTYLGFAHFYGYGKAVTGRENGYTFGADLLLDWGEKEFTAGGREGMVGLTSEMAFGLGKMEDDNDELRIRYDVNGDFFGIATGYHITDNFVVGALYNPFNLYATPNIAFLGSKFELRAAYKRLEVDLARSGDGYGYGFIAPAHDNEALTTDLRIHTGLGTFGIRYLRETPAREDSNNCYMIFWGGG
jgi:hypothetical protein